MAGILSAFHVASWKTTQESLNVISLMSRFTSPQIPKHLALPFHAVQFVKVIFWLIASGLPPAVLTSKRSSPLLQKELSTVAFLVLQSAKASEFCLYPKMSTSLIVKFSESYVMNDHSGGLTILIPLTSILVQ